MLVTLSKVNHTSAVVLSEARVHLFHAQVTAVTLAQNSFKYLLTQYIEVNINNTLHVTFTNLSKELIVCSASAVLVSPKKSARIIT